MRVRELQKQLSELDPELEVLCYSEDEKLLVEGRGFVLFDILSIGKTDGERLRLDDGTPYLKLHESPQSVAFGMLDITSDF